MDKKMASIIFLRGYFACLDDYSIWNDGVQRIGALRRDIKDIKTKLLQEYGLTTKEMEGE